VEPAASWTRARRIQQPDERLAIAQGQLAYPGSLELLADRAHRTGHDREVVSDDPDLATVDPSVAGDHAIGGSALRVGLSAPHRLLVGEHPQLDECAPVEKKVDALAHG
jgi:hypothetical protein